MMTPERLAEIRERFHTWGATCGEYKHVDDMASELLDEVDRLQKALDDAVEAGIGYDPMRPIPGD